jgi:hypothetical protein
LLDAYLSDNTKARELQPDGSYAPIARGAESLTEAFDSQLYFIGHSGLD